jgi:hypothetical protein
LISAPTSSSKSSKLLPEYADLPRCHDTARDGGICGLCSRICQSINSCTWHKSSGGNLLPETPAVSTPSWKTLEMVQSQILLEFCDFAQLDHRSLPAQYSSSPPLPCFVTEKLDLVPGEVGKQLVSLYRTKPGTSSWTLLVLYHHGPELRATSIP